MPAEGAVDAAKEGDRLALGLGADLQILPAHPLAILGKIAPILCPDDRIGQGVCAAGGVDAQHFGNVETVGAVVGHGAATAEGEHPGAQAVVCADGGCGLLVEGHIKGLARFGVGLDVLGKDPLAVFAFDALHMRAAIAVIPSKLHPGAVEPGRTADEDRCPAHRHPHQSPGGRFQLVGPHFAFKSRIDQHRYSCRVCGTVEDGYFLIRNNLTPIVYQNAHFVQPPFSMGKRSAHRIGIPTPEATFYRELCSSAGSVSALTRFCMRLE